MVGSATAYSVAVAGLHIRWHRWKRFDPRAKGRAFCRTQRNEAGTSDDTIRHLCIVICIASTGRSCLRPARGFGEAAMAETGTACRLGLSYDSELRSGSDLSSRRSRNYPPQTLPVSHNRCHFWHVGMV